MPARLEWDAARLRRAITPALRAGVGAAAMSMADSTRRRFTKGPRFESSAPGQPPNIQRGYLRNSVVHVMKDGLEASVGTNVPYGRVQEFGAIIRPKRRKYLTVPVSIEAKRLSEKGVSARDVKGLVPIKRTGKPMLLAMSNGGKPDVWYVLKKSVKLPPRPWLRPVMRSKEAKDRAQRVMVGTIQRQLVQRSGGV
jgi:phage gpG-like protein